VRDDDAGRTPPPPFLAARTPAYCLETS